MLENANWPLAAAVLISLVAVPLILLSRRRPNLREFWTLAAAFLKWGFVISLVPAVIAGQTPEWTFFEIVPGVPLQLKADSLGIFFAIVAATLWIVTSFYSIGYMRGVKARNQARYFASFAVCLSATIGIAFSANLVTFLIFYEILTFATYPLVIHSQSVAAIRAGRKYLAYTLSAGVVLVLAVIWTYKLSGTTTFQAGGFLTPDMASAKALLTLFALFIAACGVKAGLMPLHSWLPAAMIAPTPVSALLHAVAVVKAGVFALLRIVGFVFGPETLRAINGWELLAWVATATLILASLLAFQQNELKKRLAYSTIAHLSYIVLGAALLGMTSWEGSLLHLANHATLKITLFFAAGAIFVKTRRDQISDLNGIGRQMPFTMGAFALASLGLAGVPPLNGFISKFYLAWGAAEQNQTIFFFAFILAGLLCGGYLLPIVFRAFFLKGDETKPRFAEANLFLVVPLCLTALLSLILGILPNGLGHLVDIARNVAQSVTGVGL